MSKVYATKSKFLPKYSIPNEMPNRYGSLSNITGVFTKDEPWKWLLSHYSLFTFTMFYANLDNCKANEWLEKAYHIKKSQGVG